MNPSILTPAARRALSEVGRDLSIARRKRRISQADLAARMGVSPSTVKRLEAGEPGVSIGTLAMAFLSLGALDRLRHVLDVGSDDIGLLEDLSRLPKRVRKRGGSRARQAETFDGDTAPGADTAPDPDAGLAL